MRVRGKRQRFLIGNGRFVIGQMNTGDIRSRPSNKGTITVFAKNICVYLLLADQIAETTKGGFREWLVDSALLSAPSFDWWTPGGNYDESYYSGKIADLSHILVQKAAYRLAAQLNEIFDYEN